jgi:hypothetical protein
MRTNYSIIFGADIMTCAGARSDMSLSENSALDCGIVVKSVKNYIFFYLPLS